jgi:hypothetical protein
MTVAAAEAPVSMLARTLQFSVLIEVGTGLGLMLIPTAVLSLLVGSAIADAWLPFGRCFGVGLLALGISCWPDRPYTRVSPPAFRGLLVYNSLIALYLAYLASVGQWRGKGLWPAAALHAAVALQLVLVRRRERRPA